MRSLVLFGLAACSSSAPPPAQPSPAPPVDAPVAIDAAPDALPAALLDAPSWIFRYASAARTETWTLRTADGMALLDVVSGSGTLRYAGTATDGPALVVEVSTATAKIKLDCKRVSREVDAPCAGLAKKPKPKKTRVDALDCFHADFKEPMPFGPAPGIEYVADGACAGYRAIAP